MMRQYAADPCACGSGKKHRSCCMKQLQARLRLDKWAGYRIEWLVDFHYERRFNRDYHVSRRQYYGFDPFDVDRDFIEWYAHDYTLKDYGKSLLELFVEENVAGLDESKLEVMSGWARSPRCLYEVIELKTGLGYTARNIFDRTECFVCDVSASYSLMPHYILSMRLYTGDVTITSGVAIHGIAPEHKNRIVEFVLNGAEKTGHSDVMEYLKDHSLAVVWLVKMHQDVLLHMIGADEDASVHTAHYVVNRYDKICSALDRDGLVHVHDADGVHTYCLLGNGGKPSPEEICEAVMRPAGPGISGLPDMRDTSGHGSLDIAAHIVFDHRILYVDCVSDQALRNTRRRVERALGSDITHVGDRVMDADSITVQGHTRYIT